MSSTTHIYYSMFLFNTSFFYISCFHRISFVLYRKSQFPSRISFSIPTITDARKMTSECVSRYTYLSIFSYICIHINNKQIHIYIYIYMYVQLHGYKHNARNKQYIHLYVYNIYTYLCICYNILVTVKSDCALVPIFCQDVFQTCLFYKSY